MESREEIARAQGILQQPEVFGHEVGFTDLTRLHGEWIREMVFGKEDYTLQAQRGESALKKKGTKKGGFWL